MIHCNFDNIICGGCSFTQDGIGGLPPIDQSTGGNSFVFDVEHGVKMPRTWASHVAQRLQPKSFVNVAASGHGNILTSVVIRYLIHTFNYCPSNTLIVFNITDPARLDLMCDYESNYKSTVLPWNRDIIPFGFMDRTDDTFENIECAVGYDSIELNTSLSLMSLIDFLHSAGYNFFFLTMRDYRQVKSYKWLYNQYADKLIEMDSFSGMTEYCMYHGLTISSKDEHPNNQGHREIAQIVLRYLGCTAERVPIKD